MQITTDELPPTPTSELLLVATDIFLFLVVIGFFIYILHRQSHSQKAPDTSSMKPSLTVLIVSLLLIAIFGPSNLNIYPELERDALVYFVGMSWEIMGTYIIDIVFSFSLFLVVLPFMFLRLVFVYQIYKYYIGSTTRTRAVITGILGELQFPLISLAIVPIGLLSPGFAVIISIPIPILLLVGLLMIRYIPRAKGISEWTDLDEGKEWWDKEKEDALQQQ